MNKVKPTSIRLLLALSILCSCVGCDQATKSIATLTLRDRPQQSFLADTIRLDFAQNPGGFLSLGAGMPDVFRTTVFVALNSCMMLAIISYLCLKRKITLALFVSLVFVLAGGIGNLIDRVWNNGLVTDFINVGIGPIRTGVFNVADMAVMFGAIAVGCLTLKREAGEQADAPKPPNGAF